MAKEQVSQPSSGAISIIAPGTKVHGDIETDGTLRVEGAVDGTIKAAKAVVVGKDGVVDGDINTQDAVIGGRVNGTVVAESRLELQATCVIDGEIRARRVKLEEGGKVNGQVAMGESFPPREAIAKPLRDIPA
ncbi:MAG TPA: polymer-forming cytoskeletal protein [Longimicrobiales bacterium]